jgi:hypothetical protein
MLFNTEGKYQISGIEISDDIDNLTLKHNYLGVSFFFTKDNKNLVDCIY